MDLTTRGFRIEPPGDRADPPDAAARDYAAYIERLEGQIAVRSPEAAPETDEESASSRGSHA